MTPDPEDHPTRLPDDTGLQDLTDDAVPDFLDRHPLAVLLFVHAGDAGGERMRERVTRVALERAGQAGFGAVDVTEHPLVAHAIGVKSTPALLVFERGTTVDRIMGTPPEEIVRETVDARLGRARG